LIPVAGLNGGPNAAFFAPPLEAEDDSLLIPTLCLYEVYKTVMTQYGRKEAGERIAVMRQGTIVSLDDALALEAAIISKETKLPMADSIILATARSFSAVLKTQDAHFETIAGVQYCSKSYT